MKQKLKKIVGIILSIGIGVFIIWWSVKGLTNTQLTDIKNAIVNANYFWIGISVIIGLLSHFSRAYRWKYLLEPLGYQPKFWNSVFAIFIAYLVNLIIPRGGEVVRATTISKYEAIPFEKAFGTIVSERVVDLILLLLIILGALFYQFSFVSELLLAKVPQNPFLLILTGFLSLVLVYYAYRFIRRSEYKWLKKISGFIDGLIEGVISIWTMENRGAFIFHSVFIWAMYLLMFYVISLAIPETSNLSLGAVLNGFIGGTFGTSANGGLGTFPYAVQKVFEMYQINPDKAFAFGWLVWSAQTLMILVFGLISLIVIPIYNRKFLE